MSRLLICSPGIPHESEGASVVLFYQYIAGLKAAGFEILNILLLQPDNSDDKRLSAYVSKIEGPNFAVAPIRRESFLRVRRFSIDIDRTVMEEVQNQAAWFRPDVILCFDILSAWAASTATPGSKVAWLGDLNFQTQLYHAWYSTREDFTTVIGVVPVWIHSILWRRIYRRVLSQIDRVIVSSNSSVARLARLGVRAEYEPYPWPGVVPKSSLQAAHKPSKPTFLFFGTLPALGSRSAFHFMVDSLYPRMLERWGKNGFEIRITGSLRLPDWIAEWLADKPELQFLGFVDDIDSVMATSHAVLVPIAVPVGNRSRIVTAMAKGALVVAHRNAAIGNPDLVDSQTCYLAVDATEFMDRMQRAIARPEETAAIVQRARAVYNTRFRPDVAVGRLTNLIQCLSQHTNTK